jgi:hypothetical protein
LVFQTAQANGENPTDGTLPGDQKVPFSGRTSQPQKRELLA